VTLAMLDRLLAERVAAEERVFVIWQYRDQIRVIAATWPGWSLLGVSVPRARSADQIAERLRRLPPGTVLPTAAELAAMWGVGTKSVRRVTGRLRAEGRLVSRGVPGTMGGNRLCVADGAPGLARTA
jgi:Bacterial regulatory proteins, gntR family